MNYSDPRLRNLLAGEYVLGTLPSRARARFEALMRFDAGLARLAGDWAERLGAIDATVTPIAPPARVWHAIEARTIHGAMPEQRLGRDTVRWWRAIAVGAVAVAAILAIYIGTVPLTQAPMPRLVAVLSDKDGIPGWIVADDRRHQALAIQAVRTIAVDAQHGFELWAIADNAPHPLGMVASQPGTRTRVPDARVPKNGVAFAVSLEPPGGSMTGLPTGPVLYQGKVIGP